MPDSHDRRQPDREFAIVGAGFGGLGMAIRLAQRGERDVVVLEQAESLGGTWRDNRYPGCSCDVPSHLYSYSFAPNPDWSRRYSPQAEIRDYIERCADRFGVRERIRFGARMTAAAWDEADSIWRITINGDQQVTARFLVTATGALSVPSRPRIDALEDFGGPVFHSADWDDSFDPAGLRVAVAGSGASAAQIVAALAGRAERLVVFQRTPAWVLPRGDRAFTAAERRLMRLLPGLTRAYRERDRLALEARLPVFTRPRLTAIAEARARRYIHAQVEDEATRAALTPGYRLGCKRVVLSDDYLASFNRPDVELIPEALASASAGIARGADGAERETDAIILATGFTVGAALVAGPIRGREDRDLLRTWATDPHGATAHRGTTVAGFPNLFVLSGPNTGLGHSSALLMEEAQIEHALALVDAARGRGAGVVEPRAEAQDDYNRVIRAQLDGTVWNRGGCRSWYLDRKGRNTTIWPGTTRRFRRETAAIDPAEFSFA